jgi:hypothetical protein
MASTMMTRAHTTAALLLGSLVAWGGLAGCINPVGIPGQCEKNSALSCGASAVLAGDKDAGVTDEELGLVGYSCSNGALRPDDNGKMIHGIPFGQICADMTPVPPDGQPAPTTRDYCCTSESDLANCVYNRNRDADCPEGYAYLCHGPNRPEVNNPAVTCGNGLREGDYIHYCCHHQPRPTGCTQAKGAISCKGGLIGWVCPKTMRPRGEDFGANESRADYYYFVCGVPTPAPNMRDDVYCCFSPSPVLPGGSCVYSPGSADKLLPSCEPGSGRFAFACYGRDRPDQDYYPRIQCKEPPVSGKSDTGYDAQLYCCEYVAPGQGSGAGTDPEE